MSRLPAQPGERIDRSTSVGFTFDGKRVEALAGDTIASALYAAGQRTFSRSFKYHRRRGLLCCAGQCPNCLVAVDGAPGVRACTEPVREGMAVEHLNASPSLEHDVMAVTDAVGGPFTPPGFYYKTFIRPRRLWPLYEKVLRHAAGLGKLRASQDEREWRTEYRRRHADVLVVGGGLAGLRAAIAAAEAGADVVLADEGPEPGGRALAEGGHERARELAEQARGAGVELLSSASVLGSFDGLVPIWQASTLHQVRARQLVFATGVVEQPLVFAGNDLPGVMLVRRRAAAHRPLRHRPGNPRGHRHHLGSRARGGARAGGGGRRDRGRRRPARGPDRPRGRGAQARARRGAGRPGRQRRAPRGVRPGGRVGRRGAGHLAHRAGRRAHRLRRGPRALRDRRAARSACSPRERSRARATTPSPRASAPALRPPTRWASADAPPPPSDGAAGRSAPRGRAPGRGRRRAREVLRLPVRGRHGQGHPSERRRGL